jgi:small subunit ribosomal protein S20
VVTSFVPEKEQEKNFKHGSFFLSKNSTFARPKRKTRLFFKKIAFFARNMAHHKSALKRIRQNEKRRLQNRYYKKTARTAIKNLRDLKEKAEAETFLPKVISMIDKLAKRGNIHRNKAANLKSGLTRHVNALAAAQ